MVALLFLSVATLPVLGQEAAASAEATAASAEATDGAAAEGDATNEAALATLNMEIKQAEEDQTRGSDHAGEVISKIIDEIRPGLLMAGDGDVSTTGETAGNAAAGRPMLIPDLDASQC